MENSKNCVPIGREVVGKDVNLPIKYPAHWFGPNGDVDWEAVDIRWAVVQSDGKWQLGNILESMRYRLHMFKCWFWTNGGGR